MTYDYQKPSRLNVVSVLTLLVLCGGIYGAAKFVPVWWQGRKVDRELDELKLQALDFGHASSDARDKAVERVVAQATTRIHDLGVEDQPDQPVQVWFSEDFAELHARYQVVVTHPGNVIQPTVMTMERAVEVAR